MLGHTGTLGLEEMRMGACCKERAYSPLVMGAHHNPVLKLTQVSKGQNTAEHPPELCTPALREPQPHLLSCV